MMEFFFFFSDSLLVAIVALSFVVLWIYNHKIMPKGAGNSSFRPNICRPKTTLPFLKNTLDAIRHSHRLHDWIAEQSLSFGGAPWVFEVLGQPSRVILTSPQAIEEVLKSQFNCFQKGDEMRELMIDLVGEGIFSQDGPKWFHQRKTFSHLLTRRSLRDYMALVVHQNVLDLVNILKKASNENATVDFARIFKRLTLDTFASIGYGVELGCLKSNESQPFEFALNDAMRIVMKRFVVPNWYWKLQRFLGIGDEAAMKKNLQVIDSMIYDIITKSLASKRQQQSSNTNTPADIVTLFINPHESESEGNLNPKFIRDVVVSFLLAGRDTVGDALSWVFFCMMKYPDVADKIREELRTKISRLFTSSELKPPTWEECQELVYLEAVLMEIMRLYPPISLNHKYAQYDTVLSDGTFIKKGTNVILPAYAQGRLPSVWGPDANVFRPERWIDPKTNSLHQESAYKFSIFNAGPRACPGKQFAMMELKMVTSTLLSQFAFQRVPTNGSGRRADDVGRGDDNDTPSYAVTITLSMLRSMPVNITPFIQSQKC